jgi:hypothetical protein
MKKRAVTEATVCTLLLCLFTFMGAPFVSADQDDATFDTSQSDTTVHIPFQPPSASEEQGPGHTEIAPTWPIQVPVWVPDGAGGPREQPHAGENEGSQEEGESMEQRQQEPSLGSD